MEPNWKRMLRQQQEKEASAKEKQQAQGAPPPPNACCPKAYTVPCFCGGARECPDHPGPVCFGGFSHD
jgi:hypothetical protein